MSLFIMADQDPMLNDDIYPPWFKRWQEQQAGLIPEPILSEDSIKIEQALKIDDVSWRH